MNDTMNDTADDAQNVTNEIPNLVRPERKATLRLAQRQLTLLSWTVVLLVIGAGMVAGYHVFLDFKNTRDLIIAEDNLRALYKAMRGYAMDMDEKLPQADRWTEQVAGYLSAPPNTPGGKMSYLHGENEHGNALHYVYNDLASGYKLDRVTPEEQRAAIEPSRMVLLIEAPGEAENAHVRIPPRNTPAGEEALAKLLAFPHDSGDPAKATAIVLYANGTTERLTRKDFK